MNQRNGPSRRSLLSLGLSKDTLASLMSNGYETVQDIGSVTALSLSSGASDTEGFADCGAERLTEIGITMSEAEALLASINAPALGASMTQSAAASILQHSHELSTRCEPLDQLLEGGLARDQVLEISGPPGSPREHIIKGIVASCAEEGQDGKNVRFCVEPTYLT